MKKITFRSEQKSRGCDLEAVRAARVASGWTVVASTEIVWNVYDMITRRDLVVFFVEADAIAYATALNAPGRPANLPKSSSLNRGAS